MQQNEIANSVFDSTPSSSSEFRVLVGVTGSVAALKLPLLVSRLLALPGVEVKVVTTEHATHFFNPEEVPVRVYSDKDEWELWTCRSDPVLHIDLRRWANLLVIAPLDANTLGKISSGICDNLLTCVVRAWDLTRPLVFCPAMNTAMWQHPITAKQVAVLKEFGYTEVPCIAKKLVCGDEAPKLRSVMAERVKRVSLPLGEKVQIVEELESTGVSQTIVAKKFGVSTSQVSRIMRDKARLLLQRERNYNQHRKRQRFAKEKHIDHKLLLWARQQLAEGSQVSCATLKQRATELAQAEGTAFTPSDSWITRWRDRHNITNRRRKPKDPERPQSPVAVDWQNTVLRHILESYSPADIFSAHECGLWFRAVPERYHTTWEPAGHRASNRITTLLCANMAGTERQPLLVIGSTKHPRCFPRNLDCLPVGYASASRALMTSQLFQQWLQRWDRSLRSSERRVCLLVSHGPAHPSTVPLSNIQLRFLPSSSTHVMQPMAMGVSRIWKAHYRSRLYSRIGATLLVEPGRSAEDIARNVSLLDALYLAKEAWGSVSAATIGDCFHQGVFCRDEAAEVCENTDSLAAIAVPEGLTAEEFERYVDVDSDLDATGSADRPKQTQNIEGLHVVKVEASDEDSEDEVVPAPLTLPQQVQMVAHLRQLVQESGIHTALPLLQTVEAQVHANVYQARGDHIHLL